MSVLICHRCGLITDNDRACPCGASYDEPIDLDRRRRRLDAAHAVLWTAATAREIVALITEDVEAGLLAYDEASDLICRVHARAARNQAPGTSPGAWVGF